MFGITLTGGLAKRLSDMRARAHDMRPAFLAAGEIARRSILNNFSAEGRPVKWKPLSLAYIIQSRGGKGSKYTKKGAMRKPVARRVAGSKILQLSNVMRNSISYRAYRDRAVIGTNVVYAKAQNFGHEYPSNRILPARPFMILQPEDTHEIAVALKNWIVGGDK